MNTIPRAIAAAIAIAFTALIVWASFRGDIGAEFAMITSLPWGVVSLTDLYLGFILYFGAVWLVEDKVSMRLLWAIPVFFLGNAWAFIWVAVRWEQIMARVKRT